MNDAAISGSLATTGKALSSLELMASEPMQANRGNIDATIGRFEFTVELFWKLLERILQSLGREVVYPRDILREAYAGKLINNEDTWLNMLQDRNLTLHTYDEELADKIYQNIK
ncbi:MAG: nucleotidyltransferase substrate binding protein, partial [Candidatus Melainabacteria bacterium]|nr:nucleotidyltransferase substrate binding protein [Candidatus Melainabacteria bacterium]